MSNAALAVVVSREALPRVLCPVRTSLGVVFYSCCRCAWKYRVEGDNIEVWGEVAFDAHRCEDFPRDNGT
jgi:hypothetical protein